MKRLALLAILVLATPGAGLALSSAAPTAVTGSATDVRPSSAVLNGTVNPNGRMTTYFFEYGTSASYGNKTATTSAGNASTTIAVSTSVGSLQAGRTYHFRIVATSDQGTTRGADKTFETLPAPDVTTGDATNVGPTTATLTGRVNPRGRATSYVFDYGTTTSYGSRTAATSAGSGGSTVNASANVTGLAPGTRYHYRLVAFSDVATINGADRTFTTSSRPVVVTGPASSVSATSAVVSGSVNPNGRPTTWWVEFGTTNRYGTRTGQLSAGSSTSAQNVQTTLTGLAPSTAYHYRIVARNSSGTTAGADATFTTAGPPGVATGPATAVSTTYAVVAGTVTPNGLATTWAVEYGRTTGYGIRTAAADAGSGTAPVGVSARLFGLKPGLRYHYRFVATSAAGTTVGSDASFATAPLPVRPGGRRARCTITGTQGPDVLRGTGHADVICGLGGNDRILAAGGNDIVYGGPGNDIVLAGSGNDIVFGGLGRDSLLGGTGRDVLMGEGGNDSFSTRDRWRDVVDGGWGLDTASRDRRDVLRSIERRT
jgi:phosphodiesterase/alkaline phosphatase D-like protein